jgi:plastocyanin
MSRNVSIAATAYLGLVAGAVGLALLAGAVTARATGQSVTVLQEGKKFSDPEISVKAGGTVTFENKDPVTHNVYSNTPGLAFDLRQQKPGESSTVNFDHAGVAEVQCAIHPQMKMKVHVE